MRHLDPLVEVLQQLAPVREPGQRIVVGVVMELRLDPLALRDVLDLDHRVQRIAACVADEREVDERRDDPAVGVHVALVESGVSSSPSSIRRVTSIPAATSSG